MGNILQKIGFEDLDKDEIDKEAKAFQKIMEEEKKQTYIKQAGDVYEKASGKGLGKELYNKYGKRIGLDGKVAAKDKEPSDKVKNISDADADKQVTAMEKEIEAKTRKGLMQWAVEQLYLSRPSIPTSGDVKDAAANPQGAIADANKTANKTADAATKSLLQRAKEATYLSRSGGVEGQVAANDKVAQAQSTAQSAAPTGYLATAAGYIPTSYIPGFGSASKGTEAAGDVGKQAAKLQQDVGKAVKPPLKKTDSARKSLGKLAGPALKRTESAQKKLAGSTKDQGQAATDPKQSAQDVARNPSKTLSRTTTGTKKQAGDAATKAGDVAGDAQKTVGDAVNDPTTLAKKPQEQGSEATKSAEQAAGGVTSYIPSFGLGGSSKKAKPSTPKRTTSAQAKAKQASEKAPNKGTEATGNTAGKGQDKVTDTEKTSAGYSSYLPHFGYGSSKGSQPKAAPKDAEKNVDKATKDANETPEKADQKANDTKEKAEDSIGKIEQASDGAKEATEKIKEAAEDAQKAASEGTSTANDLKSKAEGTTTDPASAPSNVAGALSSTAQSATGATAKAGSTLSDAAAGAQKYVPNSQGLGGDAGAKAGDMGRGMASGVTSGASLLGKGVGGAANTVTGAPDKEEQQQQDLGKKQSSTSKGKEKEETGDALDDDTKEEEEEEFRTPGGDKQEGVSLSRDRTPRKEGPEDPFVDDTEEDACSEDTSSTIKVSQSHYSDSASSNSDVGEETDQEDKGQGYASTAANAVGDAGKGVMGAGTAVGGAAASGVSEGVSQIGKSKWW